MYSFYLLVATFLDLSSKKKEGKNEQADPSANKSWLGRLNPFNLIPKGPPVAHLPDDKNPRVRERGGKRVEKEEVIMINFLLDCF